MMTPQQSQLVMFAVLIGVFYFLLVRPQQQRAKAHQKLVSELKVGDKIVTIGGIHGTIKEVKDDTVMLKVAEKTMIELSRNAVSRMEATPEQKS